MKTKVAFIIALMVTLFAAVVYVGAKPSESVTTYETANIVAASEETQTNTNNAVSQAQASPKKGLELVAVDSADVVDLNEVGVYIVQLQDPPLALYAGGIDGLAATNAAANGQQKLDASSADSVAYMDYLLVQQDIALADISSLLGRDVKAQYQYKATLNGFAIELSGIEAASVAEMPEIRYIEPEGEYELHTDNGPAWMGAEGIWDGTDVAGGVGTYGEGVIVGVIDTGIDPWNPSFLDVGDDAYDHTNPWGAGTYVGVCDPADPSYDATFPCNDKLIGAWGYASLPGTPRDADGHGSHTASTSAGNFVNDTTITTPSGTYTASISGVAPHANIVMYAACCTGAALTAAKDQIVIDGVDVVNYSIGSSSPTADPWNGADALQWLAARAAGIYVATSAGNNGPGDETLSSPADQPWITAVGASSHDRTFLNSMTVDDGVQTPVTLDGWSLTGPLTPAVEVVFSSAYTLSGTISDEDARLCKDGIFPAGTFTGQIVVCERGAYGRVAKGQTVLDGGAGGYILAQPDEFGGGPGSLAPDPHVLPAVHIDYYTYQDLLNYVAAATTPVMGTIAGTIKDVNPAYGDVMASFSSRGANQSSPDLIVPSVTAPGRAIWAAYHQGASDGEYTYNVIQGTSMSSPHVAGAFALLKALHPDWTPAEVQSAIMTTARDTVLNDDGINVATPFGQGSGHVDLAAAANAGFIMEITEQEYIDADPASGGQVRDLNTASLGNANCVGACTWTRTFESSVAVSVDWTSEVTGVAGLALSVTPATFTLAPGGTQVVVFEADVSAIPITTTWQFGSVSFTPDVTNTVEAHLPVAVVPATGSLPSIVEINTRRNAGSQMVSGFETIEITDMTIRAVGLVAPTVDNFTLDQADVDTVSDFPDIFFAQAPGLTEFTEVTVPADSMRFLAEIVDTTSPDLDMLVFHDADDDGVPELDDVDLDNPNAACQSASGGSYEKCDMMSPVSGRWFVAIFNYSASANAPDPVELHTAVASADVGNMTITAPVTATAGVPFDVQALYDESAMVAGETWYGAFDIGTDSGNPGNIGTVPVDVVRHDDDVTKTADTDWANIGDTVNYTITIDTNITPEDMVYMITDTIPAGLIYVPASLSASQGTASEASGVITWSDTMASLATAPTSYHMTTNATDPLCDTGFGGYVNLSAFGIQPQAGITGDNGAWTAFSGQEAFTFFGVDNTGLGFTSDGWAYHDATFSNTPLPVNTTLPDPTNPNDIMPMLWNDMEIFYDGVAGGSGVSLASAGTAVTIVEYDDVQPSGGGAVIGDFEMVAFSGVDDTPGAYEVVFAYDNVGTLPASATIGLENLDGTIGVEYLYGDPSAVVTDGLIVCFDSYVLGDLVTISYQATVSDTVAASPLTNYVDHSVDNPGSVEDTASYDLYILGEASKDVSSTLVNPGELVTYTIDIAAAPGANMYDVTDMIPSGFDFVSVDGATYVTATHSIEWSGLLGSGEASIAEGFEDTVPPTGWAKHQTGAADDPGFVQNSSQANSGAYSAYHDDANTTGDAISWLVTPQMTLPGGDADFSFWQRDFYQGYYQYHGVWVSDGSADPADGDFTEFWTADTTETWEEITLDLSAYAGTPIYVAFRYEGDYMDEWYIDDVAYQSVVSYPDSHAITLTLEASMPGYYINMVDIQTQGVTATLIAPEVEIYGATTTWDKTVQINSDMPSDWDTGPFTIFDGDMVQVVDYVSIDFTGLVSYTLSDEWTDALAISGYDMSDGSVVTGTNTLDWSLTSGISNTGYVLTTTFTVNDIDGSDNFITETLTVNVGGPAEMRMIEFNIAPTEIEVDPMALSSTQATDTVVTQTMTISNVGGLDLVWQIVDTPTPLMATPLAVTPNAVDSVKLEGSLSSLFVGVAPNGMQVPAQALSSVLWDQPNSGGTSGIVSDFYLDTGMGTYTADDFVISDTVEITEIFVEGFTNGDSLDPAATLIEWYIYADAAGVPSGNPSDGGGTEAWTFSALPTAIGVDVTDDNILLDLTAAGASQLALEPGTYWLVAFPHIDVAAHDRWNWYNGVVQGQEAALYDDGNFGGMPWTSLGGLVGWTDVAFRLSGNACDAISDVPWLSAAPMGPITTTSSNSVDVDVIFDSAGMSNGEYTANLCVSSNDMVTPLVMVPVTMTVDTPPIYYGVELSGDDAMSGFAGDVVTYTLTVTNTGNVSGDFTIAISDIWGATTTPMTVTLAAFATDTFEVVVPVGTSSSDVATVIVTSVDEATATDTAYLTTTNDTMYIYLPVILK